MAPLPRFEGALDLLPTSHMFDGELVVLDDACRPRFNELLLGRRRPTYVAFDPPTVLIWMVREYVRSIYLWRCIEQPSRSKSSSLPHSRSASDATVLRGFSGSSALRKTLRQLHPIRTANKEGLIRCETKCS
jgi:hypothetical protein